MSIPTNHPRVRVTHLGLGNYRTEIEEDGIWFITGPPWVSAQKALASVDADFVWTHFGERDGIVHHPVRGSVTSVGPYGIHVATTEAVGEIGVGEKVIISVVTT